MSLKALYFDEFGKSDVLKYGEVPEPELQANEVLVKTTYIGLNFADIYRRRGEYHIEQHQPLINGYEASGKIVKLGQAVDSELMDKEILFVDVPLANAEFVAVPTDKLIFLPTGIDLKLAASIGLQGLTADFLAHDLGKDMFDSDVFVTGISGGVGQILAQMLVADGMNVYGSASTDQKKQIALRQGSKAVFSSRNDDWVAGQLGRFDTVYDGVGATLNQSISLIKNRGKVVFFGMAGGNPPQVDFIDLFSHSKNIMSGDLWDFLTSFDERKVRSERLFRYFLDHKIWITEPRVFDLKDGQAAHDYIETGKNVGKILLRTTHN